MSKGGGKPGAQRLPTEQPTTRETSDKYTEILLLYRYLASTQTVNYEQASDKCTEVTLLLQTSSYYPPICKLLVPKFTRPFQNPWFEIPIQVLITKSWIQSRKDPGSYPGYDLLHVTISTIKRWPNHVFKAGNSSSSSNTAHFLRVCCFEVFRCFSWIETLVSWIGSRKSEILDNIQESRIDPGYWKGLCTIGDSRWSLVSLASACR